MALLTKSKYLIGLQCYKYLWIVCNEPDKLPPDSLSTKYKFEQGNIVGQYAKKLYPNGEDIPPFPFKDNIGRTKELLNERKPLFEAGILFENCFSRIDILVPVEDDKWDIIEVKSSGEVKDQYIDDVSFQRYCCEKFGIKIRKCFLMHINREYTREDEIKPDRLLETEDITSKVEEIIIGIQERINKMIEVINSDTCPDIPIGKQCNNPYDCPLIEYCWGFLSPENVFELYNCRKCFQLFKEGVISIKDIPDDFKLNDKQKVQRDCAISGRPFVNKEEIKQFLDTLQSPLYYFDFETYASVIPFFDGTKPNQKIPFQFSLHIVKKDGSIKHISYLADTNKDPRPEILQKMKEVLGNKGSIITYHKSFEEGRLKELALSFPDYQDWIESILTRIVDLETPFKNFYYYNPVQKGSASIKKILPALTGKSYGEMDINNGEDAFIKFLSVTFKEVSEEEKTKVRNDLEKYCCLDTEGMVWIVNELNNLIEK